MPERRLAPVAVALLLPLLGLGLLILRPELDLRWEHHPSHFWLVLVTAGMSLVLAFLTNQAASRHADARLVLMSLAFMVSAGFLGLHALATPGVLLDSANTGFVIATPVGLILAAVFAAASASPLAGSRGRVVLRAHRRLRWAVGVLLVTWGAASLLQVEPLRSPMTDEAVSGPVAAVAIAAVALYGYAAWRYAGIARRRSSAVALALVAAMVLLAEAIGAVAVGRSWRLSWWEWHVLMTAGFATIALATRAEYRRTGSLVATFRPIYQSATLAHIDQWHGRAMADIAALQARGEPTDRLIADLRADGASTEEISALDAAAQEVRRIDELFRPYLPQHAAARLRTSESAGELGGDVRIVSGLFADLAGFTTFSEAHAPETVIGMLNTFWESVVPVIDAWRGEVEHFAGDGVFVMFNAFSEQPDHARRAVSCALDLVATTDPIAEAHGWPRFRVGVNTGPVVAGSVGAGARRSFATIGDTTNVAARLMSAGDPGQIVAGEATIGAIEDLEGVETIPLGPLAIKGKREPVAAWAVRRRPLTNAR